MVWLLWKWMAIVNRMLIEVEVVRMKGCVDGITFVRNELPGQFVNLGLGLSVQ